MQAFLNQCNPSKDQMRCCTTPKRLVDLGVRRDILVSTSPRPMGVSNAKIAPLIVSFLKHIEILPSILQILAPGFSSSPVSLHGSPVFPRNCCPLWPDFNLFFAQKNRHPLVKITHVIIGLSTLLLNYFGHAAPFSIRYYFITLVFSFYFHSFSRFFFFLPWACDLTRQNVFFEEPSRGGSRDSPRHRHTEAILRRTSRRTLQAILVGAFDLLCGLRTGDLVASSSVYVAYPKIAQDAVNDSTLDIKKMVISDPTPDSFQLNQTQVLGSKSPYHPQIYEFDAKVSLAGAADPFTTVRVPGVKSVDGVEIHVDQMVDLSDTAAFGDYATAVMLNEEVKLNIYGTPGLKQGGLPKTSVTYNKTVVMKGLNKLEGFAVPDFHIMIPSVNGYNMNGTVYIPNPSVMTISMGNLTLNLAVKGKAMGQTYLNDLVLKPGNNTIPMLANVDQAAILTMLSPANNQYKDGIVPFTITGNSSVYHGKNLEYFTKALAANELTVNLNVYQALKEAGLDLSGSS